MIDVDPATLPAAAQAGDAIEEHDGYRGFWLRTRSAEVFVATRPVFRLLSLRRPGERSLMADRSVYEQGVRLAFMEPEQIPVSFDVGNRPVESIRREGAAAARVTLAVATGLRYHVDVSLDAQLARLHLRCALENVGPVLRTVACWSVTSFPRGQGVIVVPFADAPRSRRRLVLPFWTAWPQPGVHFGRDAIAADTSAPLVNLAYKVGVITDAGWIAYARGDEALVDSGPFDARAAYPEDGANITFFEAADGESVWCEIERLGPFRMIAPGEHASLSQTIDLIKLAPAPTDAPDLLRRAIEDKLRPLPPSPDDTAP